MNMGRAMCTAIGTVTWVHIRIGNDCNEDDVMKCLFVCLVVWVLKTHPITRLSG